MAKRLLTTSECRCFQGCARKHHYAYGQLVRPIEDAATKRFGSLVHKGLEAWWSSQGNPLDDAFVAVRGEESDPFSLVMAEEMLRLYDAMWGAEAYEVLAVEVEFRAPLRNPESGRASQQWELGGKLDGICREVSTGRVLIVEHKTSSEDITPGSEYWRRLRLDNQVSNYFTGARALGYEPVGCLYDVLLKPGLKPKKATPVEERKYTKDGRLYAVQRETDETPEEYRLRLQEALAENPERFLVRGEVVRLEEEERDAGHDLWQVSQLIREGERVGRYPRNPGNCTAYHRTCEYFDVCTGAASLDDPSRFRRLESAHEELTQGDSQHAAQ